MWAIPCQIAHFSFHIIFLSLSGIGKWLAGRQLYCVTKTAVFYAWQGAFNIGELMRHNDSADSMFSGLVFGNYICWDRTFSMQVCSWRLTGKQCTVYTYYRHTLFWFWPQHRVILSQLTVSFSYNRLSIVMDTPWILLKTIVRTYARFARKNIIFFKYYF